MLVSHRFAELFSKFAVSWPIVADDRRAWLDVLADQWIQRLLSSVWNTKRKRKSTFPSLDAAKYPFSSSLLWLAPMMLLLGYACFVDFNVFVLAAQLLLIVTITKQFK